MAIEGIAFSFVDTAGLNENIEDAIEAIGIDRAYEQMVKADMVLWLGDPAMAPDQAPDQTLCVSAKADLGSAHRGPMSVSARTGEGMDALRTEILECARNVLPKPGSVALNARQAALIGDACRSLSDIQAADDMLITAEKLRISRMSFDTLLGNTATEDMLDTLFSRFCIGK